MKPLQLPPKEKIRILDLRVDLVAPAEVLDAGRQLIQSNQAHYFVTANSLMFLEAQKSPQLQSAIENADLVIADSVGIEWAARQLGIPVPKRFPGINLAFQLCEEASKLTAPIFLLGGKPDVALKAASYLKTVFPSITIGGIHHGYFSDNDIPDIIRKITESKSRLVLVALGMPRQEEWIYNNLPSLSPALYIGIGGSFDVWAGGIRRAPNWFQKKGLEWLYRVLQEPFRWRRIAQLPHFAFHILKSKALSR